MGKIALPLAATLLLITSAARAVVPAACRAPQHRQFDFWIGSWDVYPKARPGKLVAHSKIENLYDGCAIRENWMPLSKSGGGSLSTYVPAKHGWRQFWTDNQGSSVDFAGGWNGTSMVLTGLWPQPGHPAQITRMRYTLLRNGSVEQQGATSDDHGKTWQPGFDFIYRKAK